MRDHTDGSVTVTLSVGADREVRLPGVSGRSSELTPLVAMATVQSQCSFFTVVDPSGLSLRTVFESHPPLPVVSTDRFSTTGGLGFSTVTLGGAGTLTAGLSSMIVRS